MNGTMNEQDFWQQGCVVQLDNHKTNRHFCPSDCKPRLSRQKTIFLPNVYRQNHKTNFFKC